MALDVSASRRQFIRFLAASPLAGSVSWRAWAQDSPEADRLITAPREAMNVFDFEPAMKAKVPPAHYGYMATAIDGDGTLRANREGFAKFQLRPRRLVDVNRIDMSVELFGAKWPSPIAIAPTGSNRAFHADGELAVSRAAQAGNHLQMLSTVATTSIEDAIAARGGPVWFQLYPTNEWEVAHALATRATRAGAPALVVTADVVARQNWETLQRFIRTDTRACGECHANTMQSFVARKPNFQGIDVSGIRTTGATNLTWAFVKRLRDAFPAQKILIKGILAYEDARLAVEAGLDGIVVSNHGGRAEDNGRSTIDALPEILEVVAGRVPVLVDSGFRRGTDIVKALALGARAVCIGRPHLWGLGAFGQAGVEQVLAILRRETFAAMQQLGAPSVKDLVPAMVRRA
jgi:4-hydroxymandelate oxidase